MPKKRRTRQHIIADLSVNHIERHVLTCGFSVERVNHDYGTDLVLFTYNVHGEIENGQVFIQVKATDSLNVLADQQTIAFPVKRSDLELWLVEPMPWILVVYDAQADVAYWLYLQAYFEHQKDFDVTQIGETITVYLQRSNIVDEASIKMLAQYRDKVMKQIQGVIRHDA